jgi:hypothetical protein
MPSQYKVVPFIGQSRGSLSAADVADQLERTIKRYASEGWEFYQLSDVNIEVQPGCLAGLFGAKVQYVRFDQLIFRSTRDEIHPSSREAQQSHIDSQPNSDPSQPEDTARRNGPSSSRERAARQPWRSPFCYHCGADIPADSEKCPACGLKL